MNRKSRIAWLLIVVMISSLLPLGTVAYATGEEEVVAEATVEDPAVEEPPVEASAVEEPAVEEPTIEELEVAEDVPEEVVVVEPITHEAWARVRDSQREPLENVKITYMTSSWQDAGYTDADGRIAIKVPEKFSTITVRAEYAGGRVDLRQNIVENPNVDFETVKVNVRLTDSEGQGLDGGEVIYCRSSWDDYGTTDARGNSYKELLPGTYTFRMKYENGQQDIKQNIAENAEVVFVTIHVNVRLIDSQGQGLEGGSLIYCRSSWGPYGDTDAEGNSYREMLPGTYSFRMSYENGQRDIKQDISVQPEVVFQTVRVNVRLVDSKGQGLEGGSLIYCRSSWGPYGSTDGEGNSYREMLPGTYSFRMEYELGRQDIKQNITNDPVVVFATHPLTVRCEDANAEPVSNVQIRYSRANWGDLGFTDGAGQAVKELLPSKYTVRAYLVDGYVDQKVEFPAMTSVIFVAETVVDTFTLDVRVNPAGAGSVSKSPDLPLYESGAMVTLTPTSTEGYIFDRFEDGNGTALSGDRITMDTDKVIIAQFIPVEIPQDLVLTTAVLPAAGGSIEVTPLKQMYAYGDVVTIRAIANEGYVFEGFQGYGDASEIQVEMVDHTHVQAVFKEVGTPGTLIVTNMDEMNAAELAAREDNVTILVADGTYILPDQFVIRGNNVTVKSLSGNADKVIIRGNGMTGSVPHVFSVYADNFTLEDVTIGWVRNHGVQVHGELDADYPTFRNVHFRDTREQMLKVSFSQTVDAYSEGGLVENCTFKYTAGVGPQFYIGGVDAHRAKDWVIRNNVFEDIRSPESRLGEGAIHFWSNSENTLVEGNTIIDCGRGIMFGLDTTNNYDGVIRNNFIHVTRDVGIYLCNDQGTQVYNNTVLVDSDYPNAIEYRFEPTDVAIINNLTNKAIVSRNGASAVLESNVDYATTAWFKAPERGDLHLKEAIYAVIDQGVDVDGLTVDWDGDAREVGQVDIGADEATDLAIREIESLTLEVDKTEIVNNGKDQIAIKVNAVYKDGGTALIEADQLTVTNPEGQVSVLTSAEFSSYVKGTFSLKAYAQGVASPEVRIDVIEEDLTTLQVSDIALYHKDGQTFITFEEIVRLVNDETISYKDLFYLMKAYQRDITYNVYYASHPITDLEGLEPITTIQSLSGWNKEFYGIGTSNKTNPALRYVIRDGADPLGLSTGLYVNSSDQEGVGYYLVTSVVDGVENPTILPGVNTASVVETVGQGTPVLQRVIENATFQYIKEATLNYYTRWEAPPNASIEGKAFDYLVAEPKNLANPTPVGIHMHCWGGDITGGYAWWNDAEDGSILLASNQYPYDWWTGYHENYYNADGSTNKLTQELCDEGVVRPYSTTRLISFLDWMDDNPKWNIDRARTFSAGTSMGGSGSIMMAIRFPELIAWNRSWVGVHDPNNSPNFTSSYANVYGKQAYNALFEDGTPVWDYYNDVWYLNNHIAESIGFISYSNGKNDNAIGWEQAVDFTNALQETRQPHLFIWGQGGHGQRTVLPGNESQRVMMIDARTDLSLPAFTNCTLDDDYGNGDPNVGDEQGQVNRYLYWETVDIVDTETVWEMTVGLIETSPEGQCLVDITPRRLQNFAALPGTVVFFENYDLETGELVDSGTLEVDAYGLITIEQTEVCTSNNRIIIKK